MSEWEAAKTQDADFEPEAVQSLRIAVVSDALKDRNGVDAYYRDLVDHLRGHVAAIEYMTPNPEDGELYSRFRVPLPGDATQQLIFPHATGLYRQLKQLRPHIIVAATNGPFGLFALYASYRLKARLVSGFHTLIEDLCDMYWGRVLGRVGKGYMEFQNWLLFKCSDHVVVNSKCMVDSARHLSSTPVALMGTPLDRHFLDHPLVEPSGHCQRVLYAGRLAPEKNIDSLLDCARQYPDLHFTIAGDGPLRNQVEALAVELDNLIFMGHLPRARVVEVIDQHDLLVLPSLLEAFGTIALEAMVRKRLVLVSSHCGILSWDSLAKGLFQFQPEQGLGPAIERIRELDPRLTRKKAAYARETALEVHQQAIAGWLKLFSELHCVRE